MVLCGFCRSCVLAIQFIESKTCPSSSWQLQEKDQRLKKKAECQKMSQDPAISNRTYPYLADAFAVLDVKLWFFSSGEKAILSTGKKANENSFLTELNLQITGALHPRIIHSDHRGGPEEYQISKWAHFFPSREKNTQAPPKPCATSSEALPPSPFPALDNQCGLRHHCPKHLTAPRLRSTGEVQILAQGCWSFLAEGAGTGKIPAEFQPTALRQGKPICFQVYFILHCTLLIKWTFNPFEKPHGAQIHLANLSFPPGVYLD